MKKEYIDLDGNWKEIIREFFPDFMEFFLPELHNDIDYSRTPEFLEQEFHDILEKMGGGKRITDKLVKVFLKDGSEEWILIHIEVQYYFEKRYAGHVFMLKSKLSNLHPDKRITSIVVYTSKPTPRLFDRYSEDFYGTKITYQFNAYRVWKQNEASLIANQNIFSLFVLANLYLIRTRKKEKGQMQKRLELKEKLFELALERNINLEKISRLLIFVHEIIKLPIEETREFGEFYHKTFQNNENMTQNIVLTKGKHLADVLFEGRYGDTFDNIVANEREVAAQEREKAAQEREKAAQEREIVKRHLVKGESVDTIVKEMRLELDIVTNILEAYK